MVVVGSINYGLIGLPQWAFQRGVIAATSGAIGSNNEVDFVAFNGQQANIAPFTQTWSAASHIINAGPQSSATPIMAEQSGVCCFFNFNTPVFIPDWAFQVLTTSTAAVPAIWSGL